MIKQIFSNRLIQILVIINTVLYLVRYPTTINYLHNSLTIISLLANIAVPVIAYMFGKEALTVFKSQQKSRVAIEHSMKQVYVTYKWLLNYIEEYKGTSDRYSASMLRADANKLDRMIEGLPKGLNRQYVIFRTTNGNSHTNGIAQNSLPDLVNILEEYLELND